MTTSASSFVAISDVHLNPFDKSQKYPEISQDANPYYLERMVGSMAYEATHNSSTPEFIAITGDMLAHGFPEKYKNNPDKSICGDGVSACVLKTMDKIVSTLRKTQNGVFACTPIYLALGNNDSNVDDYVIDTDFLSSLGGRYYDYSHPCNPNAAEKSKFIAAFKEGGGAYSAKTPIKDFNLVVLNSVLYANKHPKCVQQKNDDCTAVRSQQNKFIEQYSSSSPAPSLVLLHIPPFDDTAGYDNQAKPALDGKIFAGPQTYTIAGHWHMYAKLRAVDGVMLNAITYRKGVRPGFGIFSFKNNHVSLSKHCQITNPNSLPGKTIPLPISCS